MDLHETDSQQQDDFKVFDPEEYRSKKVHRYYRKKMVIEKWKNRDFFSSFEFAKTGIVTAFREERNMKKHLAVAVLVVLAGLIFRVFLVEWLFLITSIFAVIILEVLNSAIENIVDMVCGPTFSTYAKNAKDMAAGAVLLMSICAAIVGLLIFVPKFLALF